MTAAVRANFWVCATTTERDDLGSENGLRLGDIAMVQGQGLYRTSAVGLSSSTWQVLAGLPVTGVWALGGSHHGAGNQSIYQRVAINFHTPLLTTPSSIVVVAGANANWTATPSVVYSDANGFVLEGTSLAVAANVQTWARGTFTVTP